MIVEDSGLLRQLLADVLTRQGFEVAGQVATGQELLRLAGRQAPDLVILDIRLPPGFRDEGLRLAAEIRARHPSTGLLVLSHYAETSYAVRLLENGARGVGYLVKDRVQDIGRLTDAIRRVAAGETVIDPEVIQRVISRRRAADPLRRLTPGEREVLGLMAEGLSNVAISERLSCSPKTVEKRVTAITQKLGLPHAGHGGRSDINVRVLAVLTYLRNVDRP